jgi:hypothetical protein
MKLLGNRGVRHRPVSYLTFSHDAQSPANQHIGNRVDYDAELEWVNEVSRTPSVTPVQPLTWPRVARKKIAI